MDIAKPTLPARARSSRAVLLRPLQDIDVYVEDGHSEVFYNALLSRVFDGLVRFFSVIPLNGRDAVEAKAATDDGKRMSLYLIDGDLDWVAGEHSSSHPRVYVHPCYSVENYLFCPVAMEVVAYENSGRLTLEEVHGLLDWPSFEGSLELLVPLFIEFAVAHSLDTGIRTVARGYASVIEQGNGMPPRVSKAKVDKLIEAVRSEILETCAESEYWATRNRVEAHVAELDRPIRVVSGKDFLMPLQNFKAHEVSGQRMTTESLMLRLATHCDLASLDGLRRLCTEAAS